MPNIIVPQRRVWTRQPPDNARIAVNSEFAENLAEAVLCRGAFVRRLTPGLNATRSGASSVATQHGIAAKLSGAGSFIQVPAVNIAGATQYQLTAIVSIANQSSKMIFEQGESADSVAGFYLYGLAPSLLRVMINGGAGAIYSDPAFTIPASPGILTFRVDISENPCRYELWLNGARLFAETLPMSAGVFLNNALNIGSRNASSLNADGVFGDLFVHNKWMSNTRLKEFHASVWKIFAKRDRNTFVSIGGGSSLNAAASGADIATGSAALSAQVALAGVGVSVAGGAANASVAVPLSAAGIAVAGGSANGTATVSISAAGLAQAAGQVGLSAAVLLQAAGAAQAAGNATLAALLNAQAAGAAQAGGSANITGGAPGALSASGGDVASGSAVLSVSVQLQATGAAQAGGSANGVASAPGALSASGLANAGGFASWSALVTLTAAGFVQAMGAGSFQVSIPLAAAGTAQASGAAQASLGGLVNRFALQAREKRVTEAAASVWRVALVETDVARLTRMVHEVKHV